MGFSYRVDFEEEKIIKNIPTIKNDYDSTSGVTIRRN